MKPQYEYRVLYAYTNRPDPRNMPFEAEVGGLSKSREFIKRLSKLGYLDYARIERRLIGEWEPVTPKKGRKG